jgi:hypothetical protein
MQTFTEFLHDTANRGEAVNLIFEQRLFDLAGILHKITGPLMAAGVPHELIGGLAVLVHVEEADPEHTTLTRDVDLMIRRADLERVTEIASRHGFRFRHTAGLDMLLYGDTTSARHAVHLLFSGEKVRPNQATPNPAGKEEPSGRRRVHHSRRRSGAHEIERVSRQRPRACPKHGLRGPNYR